MNTEKPGAEKIKKAVDIMMSQPAFKKNVETLRNEFRRYDAGKLSAQSILSVIKN